MRRPPVAILWISLCLAVPIVPFLVLGESFEKKAASVLDPSLPKPTVAAMVIGLLASDIILPVPSTVVCTFAGGKLGILGGILSAWAGLSIGSIGAFFVARRLGRAFARKKLGEEETRRTERLVQRFGPSLVIVMRPVPVLAEASVLWLGATGLSWRAFLPPLLLANLAFAVVFVTLGALLPQAAAIPIAIVVPLALLFAVKWLRPGKEDGEEG